MGANIVEYHANRLYALLWGAISLGFAWFIASFMMSDDFQAGTITARRLRILNDIPFEWRVALIAAIVVLFVMAGLTFLKHVVWTRLASVGDEGIEVITPWRVARARWSDFKGLKLLPRLGTASLLFDAPADGSPYDRKITLPAKVLGAGNRAMLVDIQQRLASIVMPAARPMQDRMAPSAAATPRRDAGNAPRRSFGRRSA